MKFCNSKITSGGLHWGSFFQFFLFCSKHTGMAKPVVQIRSLTVRSMLPDSEACNRRRLRPIMHQVRGSFGLKWICTPYEGLWKLFRSSSVPRRSKFSFFGYGFPCLYLSLYCHHVAEKWQCQSGGFVLSSFWWDVCAFIQSNCTVQLRQVNSQCFTERQKERFKTDNRNINRHKK